MTIQILFK